MDIYKHLCTKPHNSHHLKRYYQFLIECREHNVTIITNKEVHHICPKASDLFPEFSNLNLYDWNKIELTYRQHLIAHWMLWKAYGGSQAYAFYAMNNQVSKRDGCRVCHSKIYEQAKLDASITISNTNRGFAVYVDSEGHKIRCKINDYRVKNGTLTSTSKGRQYTARSEESRARTSASLKGKTYGPMQVRHRILRRKIKVQKELFFDQKEYKFEMIDNLYINANHIKVFTNGRQVWNTDGKYRRVSIKLPISPPGWSFINPKIIIKALDITDTNFTSYIECFGTDLPSKYHTLSLCKIGKVMLYCTTLMKNIYIDKDSIATYGIPSNCTLPNRCTLR